MKHSTLSSYRPIFSVSHSTRHGFTLVELLVVIAIIGVLVALLLPAIQAAREAARRSQCQNNLKQIGLSVINFESSYKHFPSGGWGPTYTGDPNRGGGPDQPGSWIYNVLEFVEQANVRNLGSGATNGTAAYEDALIKLHTTPVSIFNCPSRRPAGVYVADWTNIKNGVGGTMTRLSETARTTGIVKSDYAASSGDSYTSAADANSDLWQPSDYNQTKVRPLWTTTDVCSDPGAGPSQRWFKSCQSGIMYYRSNLKIAQIEDGTSNTYLVGEKWVPADGYEGVLGSTTKGFSYGENQSMYTGYEWDNQRVAWNPDWYSVGEAEDFQPEQDSIGTPGRIPEVKFGSAHPAAFHMLFCDGSVRSMNYDVDFRTHRFLANRFDGQVVDVSSF